MINTISSVTFNNNQRIEMQSRQQRTLFGNFKESVFSILNQYSGNNEQNISADLILFNTNDLGCVMIAYIDALRVEGTTGSVFLDLSICPLSYDIISLVAKLCVSND